MLNFEFCNPTRIVFGKNTIARLADLVPQNARVLILLGGESARKNGTLAEVEAALGGRDVAEFSGIEPNPSFETLIKAVDQVRREKRDFLLAVGGGSVIDGTKFVAAAAMFDGDPWSIVTARGATVAAALPLACVLTLPATGSEMNSGAVVTRRATADKLPFMNPFLYPQFSILDPTKTFSLPPRQVANGVADAFVHVTEQYLTYPAGAMVQDRFAEGLLRTLIEIGPKTMADPQDYDARANLMWTATQALNGLIASGVPQDWATHMLGHELTAAFHIDHGRTLAVLLPSLLRNRREGKREKLLQYAERVWDIAEGDAESRIDTAIARTEAFFQSLGIETKLSAYGVKAEDIDALVARLEAHGLTALGERHDITPEISRSIYRAAL